MEECDGTSDGIGKVDGGAIGYVNSEELSREICDKPVHCRVEDGFFP
jgi:hypothetical protein